MTSLTPAIILSLLLCGVSTPPEQTLSQIVERTMIQHSASLSFRLNQRITYRTYQNARFDYSIAYPSTLEPQGEADNGDGQIFRSQDGTVELRVWGIHNALDQTLKDAYAEAIAAIGSSGRGAAKYKFLGRDYFVVSGTQGGKIIYQKTLFRGGIIKTFKIEYPMNSQATYDLITARIARSFKG